MSDFAIAQAALAHGHMQGSERLVLTSAALRQVQEFVLDTAYDKRPHELIPPDGLPSIYLRRWYVERSREAGNVFVHCFHRSDDDRALHCHPWSNVSVLAFGNYIEHTPEGKFLRCEGEVLYRRGDARHRVELINGVPVWTLFVTGPKVRDWGFHCPTGFVPWQDWDNGGCGDHG